MEKKINPNINIDELQKISYGSKQQDNNIIRLLSDGSLKFENLQFFYFDSQS